MRVSYSDINTYGRCAYRYFLRAHKKLQRKRKNVNLYKGSMVHTGLQTFFLELRKLQQAGENAVDPNDNIEDADAAMYLYFSTQLENLSENNPLLFEDELDDAATLIEEAQVLCERYLLRNEDEIKTWEILHVEEEFTVTLASGDEITFTPDLIVRDSNGFIWIIDHKTTSRMPSGPEVPFADLQEIVYYWGVSLIYGEAVRGFIFNYLRKKLPSIPRLNKTHNKESKAFGHYFVHDLGHIDTTYEILRDFLLKEAPVLMGEPAHQQRLAALRDEDHFFWQERLLVTNEMAGRVLDEVMGTLLQMQTSDTTQGYPKTILNDLAGPMSCAKCEFSRICHTELLGWNVDLVIEEEYEPRDPKNPYESEDDDVAD